MFKRRVRRRCYPRGSRLVTGPSRKKWWGAGALGLAVFQSVLKEYHKEIFEGVRQIFENLLARSLTGDHFRRADLTAASAER